MNTEEWAKRAEIVASAAVILTLLFLIYEVRQNTLAIERQSFLERSGNVIQPYMTSPQIPSTYAKIKQKDGLEPNVQAFIDAYELTVEEAVIWARHLEYIWVGIEADFEFQGPSEQLVILIRDLAMYPDNRIYLQHSADRHGAEFVEFVESLASEG